MEFLPSPSPTVGIELELQLLDAETLDLVDGIMPLMEFFPHCEQVKPEFIQSCVEVVSPVCENSERARRALLTSLQTVQRRCEELGMRVCGAGTHAFSERLALITPDPRFLEMKAEFGIVGRNQLTYATHVHVGMPSGNAAMFVMRHLIPCMPVLLALAANSPYWRGHETGYASYRHCILAASQSYGPPPYFEDWDDFVKFFEMTRRAGVFETFKDIHWDIRPHPDFGTLEIRVMDAASTVATATALAAITRSLAVYLLEHLSTDLIDWPFARLPPWIEHMNRQQALHRGLDAPYIVDERGSLRPIRDLAADLVRCMVPVADRIGERNGISGLEDLLAGRAGYERQIEHYREVADFREIMRTLANQLEAEIEAAR